MNFNRYRTAIVLSILIIAGLFRFIDLSSRPMHSDEAVNAIKLYDVISTGKFDYNPNQYHGPVLYFLADLLFKFQGIDVFEDLSEVSFRFVTGCVGVFLLLIVLIFNKLLQANVLYFTFALFAISPSLVYFSRFFIHEIVIVFFSLLMIASGYKYSETKKLLWVLLIGFSLGCMIATKETWPIFLFSMGTASTILYYQKGVEWLIPLKHVITILGIALTITFLFYSDFFRDVNNSTDVFLFFKPYFERTSSENIHNHPWYFYLNIIFPFFNSGNWFYLGESLLLIIFISSLPQMIGSKEQPKLILFLFWYSLSSFVVFSAIPYKTPWNILCIMPGIIIVSVNTISTQLENNFLRNIFVILLIFILSLQSYSYSFGKNNHKNPYAYVHPTEDVFIISNKINDIASVLANEINFSVFIMAKGNDYWPLPWYFRNLDNAGYWSHVPDNVESASVIIVTPDLEVDLIDQIYNNAQPGLSSLFIPLFDEMIELRPGFKINTWIKKDIYDSYKRLL